MNTQISVHAKKKFLRWFLSHYQLKSRESIWILNYLMNHESILEYVHFVREVKDCPRGLVLTAKGSDEPSFRFYKNQILTTDPEKSFHDIRMNRSEAVYVQLNFKNNFQSPEYAGVMEENPYDDQNGCLTANELRSVEYILEKTLYRKQKELLLTKIDESLDKREYDAFIRYSKQLLKLEKEHGSKQEDNRS